MILAGLVVALSLNHVALGQTRPTTRQVPVSAAQEYVGRPVEAVRIIGNSGVSTSIILNQVRTKEGERFDPATVEEDYQRIYGLKKFSNVEARIEPTDKGVIVIFQVSEQRTIGSVNFIGNTALPNSQLSPLVDLHVGESIDRFRIALARSAIEQLFRDKNYPFAHVDVDEKQLAETGDLLFRITQGPNVRIRKVSFKGNNSYTSDRLRGVVTSKSWIWIFRHGTYDPATVDDDVGALRRYYEQRGFFDCRVGRKLIWSPNNSELQIEFVIDEGAHYVVDQITFRGNTSISEAQLRKNLALVPGDFFDNDKLQKDIREIVRAYSPLGFIYVPQSNDPNYLRINDEKVFRKEPGRVEIVFDIAEGRPFHVGRVLVRGNSKTQDKVILREMRVVPGQLYNSAELEDAKDRLRALPFFSNVNITPIGEDPETRDVLVETPDKDVRTATFSVGAGVNSNGGVGGNLTYEQRNFDIANWPSSFREFFDGEALTGAGQNFRMSLEPGTVQSNFSIRFSDQWLFDQPYSFTGELYLRNRIRDVYTDRRLGTRVTFGKRFDNVWSAAVTLRLEEVDIADIEDKPIRAQEILDVAGDSSITSLGLLVRRDTTNRGLLPFKGTTTSFNIEGIGLLGGDYDFQRFTLGFDAYKLLKQDLVDRKTILALHADAGYITGDAPMFETFYAGGIGSVRGFKYRTISPRSGPDDDAIGGDFLLTGTAEVSFPLAGDNLRGVVFVDAGTVESDFEIGKIRSAVGAGFRLTLPLLGRVPIAVDFAIPVTEYENDETRVISFSLGINQ